jgi:hypothetical protein
MKSCHWTPTREFKAIEFTSRKRPGETAIVHRSTKHPGMWQVSLFDEHGPVNDSQHSDPADALKRVFPKHWRLKSFG